MKACYISGPMRGIAEYNFPAFFAAEDRLVAAGWTVIFNPARMDQQGPWAGEPDTPECRRFYARRDVKVLLHYLYAEDGHAIVVLPGWENSVGATAEVAVARWVGLRVLTLEEACR